MHLISELVSGVAGASDGTVNVYRYGTAIQGAVYTDFTGTTPAVNPISLDANGGVVLYSNELCTIEVRDEDNVVVRSFVDCAGDASVEVISSSFTGADYSGGAAGISKPTTLRAVLNMWKDSAGASNFQVLGPDGAENITSLIGKFANVFTNVKDAVYGAVGDGATNDTAAITAASNACAAAGGGVLFFPPGNYLTDTVEIGAGVSIQGSGAGCTLITVRSATSAIRTTATNNGTRCISDITVMTDVTPNNQPAIYLNQADTVIVSACELYNTGFKAEQIYIGSSVSAARIKDCFLSGAGAAQCLINNAQVLADAVVENCTFECGFGVRAHTATDALVKGQTKAIGCYVDASNVSSGTVNFMYPNTGGTIRGQAIGCELRTSASATLVGYSLTSMSSSSDWFEEVGTIMTNIAQCVLATLPVAGSPGYLRLGSRDGRQKFGTVITTAAPSAFDATNFAIHCYRMTYAGNITISCAAKGPMGAKLSLLFYNDSGADRTITFGSNMKGPVITIKNQCACGIELVSSYCETATTPTINWYVVGFAAGIYLV